MEQISNKTLTLLLLIAIVVSVTSTIISINRLNQLTPKITGFGGTTTGMVNISLAKIASIAIPDTQINFGSCAPTGGSGCNATSNLTNNNFNCTCTGGSAPDNITIRNDGNTYINVTVKTNVLASTFIGGADPYGAEMYFSVRNATDYPGCLNKTGVEIPTGFDSATGMQWDWRNFTAANTDYQACLNLTPTTNYNSMYVFAKIFIPADTPQKTGANATLTFTAVNW